MSANAATIYSNLGAGNSYDSATGWTVSGTTAPVGFQTLAQGFAALGDFDIEQIDIGFGLVSGTNSARVSLWTDSSGVTGSQLGSWDVSGIPTFGSTSTGLVTISGITGISVTSGMNYFLKIEALVSDTWAGWNWNNTGATGLLLADQGSGWTSNPDQILGAFDILGDGSVTDVPEPEALGPFLIALLAAASTFARARKRRR